MWSGGVNDPQLLAVRVVDMSATWPGGKARVPTE
jgi:hypothetical protein